jgi:hypothetical protein
MDQLFGLEGTGEASLGGAVDEDALADLKKQVARYEWILDQLSGQASVAALAARGIEVETAARDAAVAALGKHGRLMRQGEQPAKDRKSG